MRIRQDRRVRRSRQSLRSALIALILEKGFRAVTVDEVIERAGVARATFYTHYRDKDDLLLDVAREVTADLPVRDIVAHADRHRDVYQVILRGEGDGRALREFVGAVAARAEGLGADPLHARAWTGELVGVLSWWVEGGTGYTAAQITRSLRFPEEVPRSRYVSGSRCT